MKLKRNVVLVFLIGEQMLFYNILLLIGHNTMILRWNLLVGCSACGVSSICTLTYQNFLSRSSCTGGLPVL